MRDAIIGPVTPTPAFEIGSLINDPLAMYLSDIYTIGANLAGLPAISVPCGFVRDLPIGLHLVGTHFAESTLLRCVNGLEPFQKGEILVDGIAVGDPKTNLYKLREKIGMVFQRFELYPHMTAMENIVLAPRKVRKWSKEKAQAKAASR